MLRSIQSVPISPKLLKHFAGITVALTLLIALFAGGENAQLAEELAAREQQNQLARTDAEVNGPKRLIEPPEPRSAGGWGSAGPDDAEYSGGSTEPNALFGAQRGAARGRPALIASPPGPIGVSNRDRLRGSAPDGPDEQSDANDPEPYRPTVEQSNQLLEASIARSGGSGDRD